MKNNKLIISAAGSGKTTYIINEAIKTPSTEKVLITTYTEENEKEIRKKILEKCGIIPPNIIVQTWFSFLIQHGVKPYQGSMNEVMYTNKVKTLLFTNTDSSIKKDAQGKTITYKGKPVRWGKNNFEKYYFTKDWRIYSDKLSAFVVECNEKVNGEVISRLSRIFSTIYIDEVQDLAGYDLEIIKLLFKSDIKTTLVGDPRQVTYLTNHNSKNKKYRYGKIKDYLLDQCASYIDNNTIDEVLLKKSHRNNSFICNYASKLFPKFEETKPCDCIECRKNVTNHEGVFVIRQKDVTKYLEKFKPVQLRWNVTSEVNSEYPVKNFGESKGKTYERVIIYPTSDIINWIKNHESKFTKKVNGKEVEKFGTKEKFYVALTRARHSVAIVYDFNDNEELEGVIKYSFEELGD